MITITKTGKFIVNKLMLDIAIQLYQYGIDNDLKTNLVYSVFKYEARAKDIQIYYHLIHAIADLIESEPKYSCYYYHFLMKVIDFDLINELLSEPSIYSYFPTEDICYIHSIFQNPLNTFRGAELNKLSKKLSELESVKYQINVIEDKYKDKIKNLSNDEKIKLMTVVKSEKGITEEIKIDYFIRKYKLGKEMSYEINKLRSSLYLEFQDLETWSNEMDTFNEIIYPYIINFVMSILAKNNIDLTNYEILDKPFINTHTIKYILESKQDKQKRDNSKFKKLLIEISKYKKTYDSISKYLQNEGNEIETILTAKKLTNEYLQKR